MTCKRCGCTETTPCLREGVPCAWMLPDLCTACLTPEEAAIDRQFAGVVESLRAEISLARVMTTIASGLAASPHINIDTYPPASFAARVGNLARAVLEEAALLNEADDDDEEDEDAAARLVQP